MSDLAAGERPVNLVLADDDLRRSRLTTFFRLLLALPHLVWLTLWWIAANIVVVVAWVLAIVLGRVPTLLHRFLAAFVRYSAHVRAYIVLAGAPFPGFLGRAGYPVHVETAPPERQPRLAVLFRFPLAFPAFMLAVLVVLLPVPFGLLSVFMVGGAAIYASVLAWFVCLVLGRIPRGLRDLLVYGVGYGGQTSAYFYLVTARYPDTRPSHAPIGTLPHHPVRVTVADALRRSRLTVFFRLLLVLPHLIWLMLWSIPAFLCAIASWFVALATGRVPLVLHRFVAAYVRYSAHVAAYVSLVGGPFPGFTGAEGRYPVHFVIDPPERQPRLVTLFRLVLAIPAAALSYVFAYVQLLVAVYSWWYALVCGRAPEGLRDLGAALIRYHAQFIAYVFLLTSRYPHSSPALASPSAQLAPAPAPLGESY